MTQLLEDELRTYEAQKVDLIARAKGKFALIKGDTVHDVFDTRMDAVRQGHERAPDSPGSRTGVDEIEAKVAEDFLVGQRRHGRCGQRKEAQQHPETLDPPAGKDATAAASREIRSTPVHRSPSLQHVERQPHVGRGREPLTGALVQTSQDQIGKAARQVGTQLLGSWRDHVAVHA